MIPTDLSDFTCKGKIFEVICGGCGAKLRFYKRYVPVEMLNEARDEIIKLNEIINQQSRELDRKDKE